MNKKEDQNFIEEIEKNSKIFNEKISKLNSNYDSENSLKNKEFKKYKFTKKKNISKKQSYYTENNYEDNPFIKEKTNLKSKKIQRINKKYDFNLNELDNFVDLHKKGRENNINNNTIDNPKNQEKYIFKSDLNQDYIIDENSDRNLIDDLKQTIIQKSNFIKLLKSEIESKKKLPTQEEYDELNNNYNKVLNELEAEKNKIKTKDEEINKLKMILDSILAQNKNMKGVINKKENELQNMKSSIKNMKEELKSSNNKMNDEIINQKKISRDYDILNEKYNLLNSEKDNLNKDLERIKNENLNLKKENIQLKKLNNKLKEEIKINTLKSEALKNNHEYKTFNKINDIQEKTSKYNNKNILNESQTKNKKDNNTNKITNRSSEDSEEKIIYNNDDDSEEEENSFSEKYSKLKNKMDKEKNIKRNLVQDLAFDKIYNSNPINRIDNVNEKEKYKESTTIIKFRDKIIGCNREKIKLLIKGKEYKKIENEINLLNQEKEKIENELLKIPNKPRKLSDIKNKKEIKDAINKIENDIKYIKAMLKNKDNYNIN